MLSKVKKFIRSRYIQVSMSVCALACLCTAGASAVGEVTPDPMVGINAAFTTGFTKMASDAMGMIALIVPIAIGVAGTIFVVRKAMSWFKGLAK